MPGGIGKEKHWEVGSGLIHIPSTTWNRTININIALHGQTAGPTTLRHGSYTVRQFVTIS